MTFEEWEKRYPNEWDNVLKMDERWRPLWGARDVVLLLKSAKRLASDCRARVIEHGGNGRHQPTGFLHAFAEIIGLYCSDMLVVYFDLVDRYEGLRTDTIRLHAELDRLTAERDEYKDQLQKIGRKAFWAASTK